MRTHPGRQSKRLKGYDYRSYGAYFVTVCVQNRRCLFGSVSDDSMLLSRNGRIAQRCWLDTPNHFQYTTLDQYVVMPNHFHGIVWISIRALLEATIKPNVTPPAGFLKDSLSSVIASFKSAVTRTANRLSGESGRSCWQRGFVDHVIRDDDELQVIRQYIMDNPRKWKIDRENPRRTGVNPFYAWLEAQVP